jgi:hypothetical protein
MPIKILDLVTLKMHFIYTVMNATLQTLALVSKTGRRGGGGAPWSHNSIGVITFLTNFNVNDAKNPSNKKKNSFCFHPWSKMPFWFEVMGCV